MREDKSQVFYTVSQFAKRFGRYTPETVIYGYAKLLTMDEEQIKNLISDENMEDLEAAHKWFSDNKLDLNLIKSGLLLLISVIVEDDERKSHLQAFDDFLNDEKEYTSCEILDKAISESSLDFRGKFSEKMSMDGIFAYQSYLKEKYSSEKKERESVTENDNEPKAAEDNSERKADNGNGLTKLSEEYRELSTKLLEVVKGQDHAVLKFIQGYNQGELLKNTERGKHPRSYFFFFGPPGVGKTLLAETVAETLGLPFKMYNMSEFSGYQSHEDLIGTSKMYNNAKEGTLVKFVRENPECILLFDEIEKAHINVIRLFLQILGSGKLQNIFSGGDVSFQDATIIFTSNVGRELYADRSVNLSTLPERVLIDAIRSEKNSNGSPALPAEICSRIASGNTVLFNHLSVRNLVEMININFEKIVQNMRREYGVSITYSRYLPLLFLYNRGGDIDARVATMQSGKFLKDEIYELLRQLSNSSEHHDVMSINIDIDWDCVEPELMHLFKNEEKANVIFFTSETYDCTGELTNDMYTVRRAATLEEALNMAKQDVASVYIDPYYGRDTYGETVLSIADYNTDGVKLFHELVEKQVNLPIYMLETDKPFSEVDRHTFMQEGAAGTVILRKDQTESFRRRFEQTQDELYMEKKSQEFSQRGWIIDFNTKQEFSEGEAKIQFYNLRKRMAVDVESRGSILSDVQRPNVKFADVIGAENAKEELRYFVKYLKNPKQFLMKGGKPPKGVLLYGPPGTGKTMLAKAMAGESDVTFLQTSASEFMSRYVGDSEANIRKLFKKAKKYAPAIIFIDEIDAIGKKRTGSEHTHSTETMLNALLTEMDGFSGADPNRPVFVLAATNFRVGDESDGISSLDEALIRRFDNKIYVDLPKESERKAYLKLMVEKKKLTDVSDGAIQSIAERTTGQSLAVLANVLDLALRNATRQLHNVSDGDLLTALEEYNFGEKREHSPEYYRRVAIHETGHAYVSYISGDKPSYVTIESRGDFGGYMQHANIEKVTDHTREELLARIRTSLAGRAAEQVFYGKDKGLNTGASSDLKKATDTAFNILYKYGMEDEQLVVLSRDDILKSTLASQYVSKVNEILNAEMKNTIDIIQGAKDKIEKIADVLAKENRLTGKQFEEMMEG